MKELDLSLHRNVPVKTVKAPLQFKPEEIRKHFSDTVDALSEQFATADYLREQGKDSEAENIHRSQVVFLLSAFDFFMHEVSRYGLVQIYSSSDNWEENSSYGNIVLPLSELQKALSCSNDIEWFDGFVMNHYAGTTMMDHRSVKEQLTMIGIDFRKIANSVFYDRNSRISVEKQMKDFLEMLYKRRNAIAHQSDRSFADARSNHIEELEVRAYISKVSAIVDAIIVEINDRNNVA